ncbi:MAG: methyltransferase domain-containing protein [bacterium]
MKLFPWHPPQTPVPPVQAEARCPICDCVKQEILECGRTTFVTGSSRTHAEIQNGRKFRCSACGHIWTSWMSKDLKDVSALYDGIYKETANESVDVNFRSAYQLELLTLALLASGKKTPCLDFGCGPNSSVALMLNKLGMPAQCCDISNYYPYDNEVFFRHSADARWHNRFGGVVSVDVIEHLGDTLDTWLYFNRILKPNGVMYHIFPTTIHYGLDHHYITNAFHLCIFSEQSLRLLCDKTGFEFRGFVPSKIPSKDPTLQQIFHFEKTREV